MEAEEERWKRIAAGLAGPSVAPSEAFVARVLARIEAEEAPASGGRWPWLVPALAFAAAALILALPGPSRSAAEQPEAVELEAEL